jgi:hypothetical protein
MTRGRWIALVTGAITIIITLLLLAMVPGPTETGIATPLPFMLASAETRPEPPKVSCVDPIERERIREIALMGIDKGLEQAMSHLFEVWQRDPNTEQPKRAQVGTANAINAHIRGRKLALAWDPPPC